MSDCLNMGESPAYQPLKGLQDIRCLRDLNEDAVRDILRSRLGRSDLTVESMGELSDMSGTNDAFNSSICSLEVTARIPSSLEPSAEGDKSSKQEDKSSPGSPSHSQGDDTASAQQLLPAETANNQSVLKTFHFVIKSPPKATFIKMIHKITKPFMNEVTWYTDFLRQAELLETELKDNTFKMRDLVPTCYHAYSNYYSGDAACPCSGKLLPWFCCLPFKSSEQGILVMENVKEAGYRMFNKMKILPLDHFLLAMKNLAHFHGRWLTYRWLSEQGKLPAGSWSVDQLKSLLDTQKRPPPFIYKELLKGTEKTVLKIMQLENMTEHSDRLREFFRVTALNQLDMVMGEVSTPVDTCCHGDFWSNNIMFRYDAEGNPTQTVLVDFQLISYGHPAYDVLYLLYLSSDLQFRDEHMKECLDAYWDVFSTYVNSQHRPADFNYDKEDFMADIRTYKTIGFVLACTLLPNVLSDTQVEAGGLLALRDLQRKQAAELMDNTKETSKEIKRRLTDLVKELVRDKVL